MRRTDPAEHGFTVLDVLIASGVIATGLVTLAALAGLATGANASAADLTRAALFAEQKLEEVRAPSGAPMAADGLERVEYLQPDGRILPASAAGSSTFERRWRAMPLPGGPPTAVLVHVEVARRVVVGRDAAVSLTSVLRAPP